MEIDENGVVNPLRVPSPIRDGWQRFADLPRLARLFVVLAAVHFAFAVLRARGVYLFAIGDAVLVLLPVGVLWRRRDAAIATPWVLRGTVLIAAGELAGTAFGAFDAWLPNDLVDPETLGVDAPRVVRGLTIMLMSAAGWWMVARAISGLRQGRDGWHRVAGLGVALAAVATAIGFLALTYPLGDSQLGAWAVVYLAVESVSMLATAYVGWVFVTRAGTPPRRATWSAAAGAAILAASSIPTLALAISIQLLVVRDDSTLSLQTVGFWIQSIAHLVAPFLFVLAFASGLADPGPRGRISAESAPAD